MADSDAYTAEQEYLRGLVAEAIAEADADPTAVTNADAIADAVAAGLLRPEDLQRSDLISDVEYEAAQRWR